MRLFLTLLLAVLGALGQSLNLSHDLVAKGIAARNMTPNTPKLDSRPLFQAGVAYAADQGPAAATTTPEGLRNGMDASQ